MSENFSQWQKEHNLFRDKTIEIYMFFKNNPEVKEADFLLGGKKISIKKPEWIKEYNTIKIREYFSKNKENNKNKTIELESKKHEENELKLIDCFNDFVKQYNAIPTFKEICRICNVKLIDYFSSIEDLEKDPRTINCLNESFFTEEYRENTIDEIRKYKRFVISTVVSGKTVNESFLNSLKNYCNKNNAKMLLLPLEDAWNRSKKYKYNFDYSLKDIPIIYKKTYLNDNLFISDIKVSAKQIHEFTGLDRMTVDGSMIVGSPKQSLKYVANNIHKLPKALISTGAITEPEYNKEQYMSKRLSTIAEFDHVLGAIIVEIQDSEIFHFRQVQAGKNGEIIDLGIQYNPDNSIDLINDSVVVFGDAHVNVRDKNVVESAKDICLQVGCNEIVLHDLFNATSITHHDYNKPALKAIKHLKKESSLKKEGVEIVEYLRDLKSLFEKITVVKSNHDLALDRYLIEFRFKDDLENLYFSLDLTKALIEQKDPLKYMLEEKLGLEKDSVNFLELDEEYRVYGIECGMHGHLGSNGARGSVTSLEKGVGKVMCGHAHTPRIYRDVWVVGTFSKTILDYNAGMSSWMNTMGVIYPNGSRQLINIIKSDNKTYYTI